jgi:predicted HicB family RNase H-like nuclease
MEKSTVIYMRIPEWLHAELKRIAREDDRSLNNLVVKALKAWHRDAEPASTEMLRPS